MTFDTKNARDAISEFMSLEEAGGHDVEADIARYEADSAVTAVVEVVNVTTGERFRTPRVRVNETQLTIKYICFFCLFLQIFNE